MALPHLTAGVAAGALCLVLTTHAMASPAGDWTAPGPRLSIVQHGRPGAPDLGCSSDTACTGIDLFAGAALAPGGAHTTVLTLGNTGRSTVRRLDLVAGRCAPSGARTALGASLCSALRLRVSVVDARGRTTTPVRDVAFDHLVRTPMQLTPPAAPDEQETVRLTVTLDRDVSPAIQGGSVSEPMSWHASV